MVSDVRVITPQISLMYGFTIYYQYLYCLQVTLNNIPEYIKVWEGKPLLPRDYGLKHFDRKPWQRPKSDYGLRSGGWRRRRKTSKDGMASAISEADQEVEFERSCVNDDDNHKARLAWGQDDGWDGQSDNNKVSIN